MFPFEPLPAFHGAQRANKNVEYSRKYKHNVNVVVATMFTDKIELKKIWLHTNWNP